MMIIKIILLIGILGSSAFIGILISGKYKTRVKELKEVKKALNIFETKIKFTYEPIPEIFTEIGNNVIYSIGEIFLNASRYMKKSNAKVAWEQALQDAKTSMHPEDIEVIKGLGKLLGKTDLEGQVSEIELTNTFLETQIQKAEKECEKNEKLYKTLRNGYRISISNNASLIDKKW